VAKLTTKSHISFKPAYYADIESISFYNSICLIVKGRSANTIGGRVVAGDVALVQSALPQPGSAMPVPFQKKTLNKFKLKNDKKHQKKRHHPRGRLWYPFVPRNTSC
jgi:hypothetical protein